MPRPMLTPAPWHRQVMLHAISHKVALYFVAPVGGLAVTTNFLQHRNPLVLLWGITGLSLVLLANVHLAFLHARS